MGYAGHRSNPRRIDAKTVLYSRYSSIPVACVLCFCDSRAAMAFNPPPDLVPNDCLRGVLDRGIGLGTGAHHYGDNHIEADITPRDRVYNMHCSIYFYIRTMDGLSKRSL
jgi:hypothetical protein